MQSQKVHRQVHDRVAPDNLNGTVLLFNAGKNELVFQSYHQLLERRVSHWKQALGVPCKGDPILRHGIVR